MDLNEIAKTVQQVGLPIVGAVTFAFCLWKLGLRALDKAEARLDAKEVECAKERDAHAAERKEHSAAHLAAIGALTDQIRQTNQSVGTLGEAVKEHLRRAV